MFGDKSVVVVDKNDVAVRVEALRLLPAKFVGGKSEDIAHMLGTLADHRITDVEFPGATDEATQALESAKSELRNMFWSAQAREKSARDQIEPFTLPAFPGVDIDAVYDAPASRVLENSIDVLFLEATKADLRNAVQAMLSLNVAAEVILSIVQDELTVTA